MRADRRVAGIGVLSERRAGDALSRRNRAAIMGAVLAGHALLLLSWAWVRGNPAISPVESNGGGGEGALAVFTLSAAPAEGPSGAAEDAAPIPLPGEIPVEPNPMASAARSGAGAAADLAALNEAIAGAVADDPLGGAERADYRSRLMRHIMRFRQPLREAGATGTVIVRFRVDRTGAIVDARVVSTHGPVLDEAALATLWRAEPLPGVPAHMAAPLDVEMPIDFRVRA